MTLSVITINFNNLQGLINTYNSLKAQTFTDWEWIVIDGGSTQGDKLFIEQHQTEMAYWCSEKDNGVYNAMNKGITKARGSYHIFMNSGDTFHSPLVLEKVFCKERQADVLYGDWVQLFEDGSTYTVSAPKVFSLHSICRDNICHQAMFIRGEVMKQHPYNESFRLYADWVEWIELALKGYTFEYVPSTICNFMMGGMCCTETEGMKEEKERMWNEVIPSSLAETIHYVDKAENKHPLSAEADRLIAKRKLFKKVIHMAIRLCHIFE